VGAAHPTFSRRISRRAKRSCAKRRKPNKFPYPTTSSAFIAKVIPSNIRELEGSLIRVVAFASLTKSTITVELAAEVLKNAVAAAPMHRVTIPLIKDKVSKFFGISIKEMEAQRRDQRVTLPRQVAMYIAWQLTGASLPQIAREFGKKDHTTAMYARDKIADADGLRRSLPQTASAPSSPKSSQTNDPCAEHSRA